MQEQIDANKRVIASSDGMLAPVLGSEQWLSLGTGHVTGFCRSANHGCKTKIQNLADANGFIDLPSLKRQKNLKMMSKVGTVVSLKWQASRENPRVVDALLTTNMVVVNVVDGVA